MSWIDIENAMQAAIVRASDLTPDQVFWSYSNYNAPDMDYVEINFGGEIQLGIDWVRNSQDLTRPNGQEIRQDIHGVREVPFEISVFTNAVTGEAAARRLCEKIRTKLRLSSVRAGIRAAGVSPFDAGPVQWVPDIPNAQFRGRATVTVRCYVPVVDCFEYVGYIARVRGTIYPVGPINWHGASGIPFDTSGVSGYPQIQQLVFYGGAGTGTYDAAFILGLASKVESFRQDIYTINAGATAYSYWAAPTTFGVGDFLDADTEIGASFSQVAAGVSVSGTSYDLFRSAQYGLGIWRLQIT